MDQIKIWIKIVLTFSILYVPNLFSQSIKGQISIVSFNIQGWRIVTNNSDQPSLDDQAEVAKKLNPDVICFQEVVRFSENSIEYPNQDRVQIMADSLGLGHLAFFRPDTNTFGTTTYGLSVISRWPISNIQGIQLPTDNSPGYPRHILETTVTPDNGLPQVKVVSLPFQHSGNGANDREEGARFLNTLYEDETMPIFVAGDYNANPSSEPIRILTEDGGWKQTINENIDDILYLHDTLWNVLVSQSVDNEGSSDHPLVQGIYEYTQTVSTSPPSMFNRKINFYYDRLNNTLKISPSNYYSDNQILKVSNISGSILYSSTMLGSIQEVKLPQEPGIFFISLTSSENYELRKFYKF